MLEDVTMTHNRIASAFGAAPRLPGPVR